jgi:hypothetical protein
VLTLAHVQDVPQELREVSSKQQKINFTEFSDRSSSRTGSQKLNFEKINYVLIFNNVIKNK